MTAKDVIKKLGGVKAVANLTGLTTGRVYHFTHLNYIPRHWLMLFHEKDNSIPLELSPVSKP